MFLAVPLTDEEFASAISPPLPFAEAGDAGADAGTGNNAGAWRKVGTEAKKPH